MCGIIGGWWNTQLNHVTGRIDSSLDAMKNRGPDCRGIKIVHRKNSTLAFGHNRLAIIDLSSAGVQPMTSKDKRYTIVFNGEVYNYIEIRKKLSNLGIKFDTKTDTEVLLNAWIVWGQGCLSSIIGMWAFAIYDRITEEIVCVRDAFGIKPLFYMRNKNRFIFSSEQQALWILNGEKPEPDLQRCYDYLVPGDYDSQQRTFIKDVMQLSPASLIIFNTKTQVFKKPQAWWNPDVRQNSQLSFSQAAEAVRETFIENVRLHMRSDVPIGAALSGGIDSSALVSTMRFIEPELPIHTFSFVDQDNKISEQPWIEIMNNHVYSIPHQFLTNNIDLVNDIDDLISTQGEPFGGTSVYGQYKVFQLAKKEGITVTLDGQGADELFAGYDGFPGFRILSMIEAHNPLLAIYFLHQWSKWPGRSLVGGIKKFLGLFFPKLLYCEECGWMGCDPKPVWLDSNELISHGVNICRHKKTLPIEERTRRLTGQLKHSLIKKGLVSLLRHADRDSMRFSVESRVPFLTIPMAELALSLPEEYLIGNNGETKKVFRAAMRGIVPEQILNRRDKVGFATPELRWIITNKEIVEEWLTLSKGISFIKTDQIIDQFRNVVNNKSAFSWQVWCWINFSKWHSWINNYEMPNIHSFVDQPNKILEIENHEY